MLSDRFSVTDLVHPLLVVPLYVVSVSGAGNEDLSFTDLLRQQGYPNHHGESSAWHYPSSQTFIDLGSPSPDAYVGAQFVHYSPPFLPHSDPSDRSSTPDEAQAPYKQPFRREEAHPFEQATTSMAAANHPVSGSYEHRPLGHKTDPNLIRSVLQVYDNSEAAIASRRFELYHLWRELGFRLQKLKIHPDLLSLQDAREPHQFELLRKQLQHHINLKRAVFLGTTRDYYGRAYAVPILNDAVRYQLVNAEPDDKVAFAFIGIHPHKLPDISWYGYALLDHSKRKDLLYALAGNKNVKTIAEILKP